MIISESWIWCGVNCRECFMRMVLGLGSIVVKYAMFEREGHEVFETRDFWLDVRMALRSCTSWREAFFCETR